MTQTELLIRIKARKDRPGEAATLNWDFLIPPMIPDALLTFTAQTKGSSLLTKEFATSNVANSSVDISNLTVLTSDNLLLSDDDSNPFEKVVTNTGLELFWIADDDTLSKLNLEDSLTGYFTLTGMKLDIKVITSYTGPLTITGTRIPSLATIPKQLEPLFISIMLQMTLGAK